MRNISFPTVSHTKQHLMLQVIRSFLGQSEIKAKLKHEMWEKYLNFIQSAFHRTEQEANDTVMSETLCLNKFHSSAFYLKAHQFSLARRRSNPAKWKLNAWRKALIQF